MSEVATILQQLKALNESPDKNAMSMLIGLLQRKLEDYIRRDERLDKVVDGVIPQMELNENAYARPIPF